MASFGINLLLWTRSAAALDAELCGRLAALGYDGAEVPLDPHFPERYAGISSLLRSSGLRCTCTGRGAPAENLISADADIRRAGLVRIKQMLDLAAELGAEVLAGPLHSAPGHFTGTGPTDDEISWAAEGLRSASEYAAGLDILLCPEILNRFESHLLNTVEQAVEIADRVDHPAYGVHYDTFHAHIEERSVAAAIALGASRIRHVHFSESDRGIPGTGQVNWTETVMSLRQIEYDGWIVAEAFARGNAPLARAMHAWRQVHPSERIFAEEALTNMKRIWREAV